MKRIMVLSWTHRARICTHCQKWSTFTTDIMDLDNEDRLHVCIECYEALVSTLTIDSCAEGSCET